MIFSQWSGTDPNKYMNIKILGASMFIFLAFGSNSFASSNLSVQKTVQDITNNTVFGDSIAANFGDEMVYKIIISTASTSAIAVYAKDIMPAGLVYVGNLFIDGVLDNRSIIDGILIGDIATGTSKTITYRAKVSSQEAFNKGTNNLISSVLVYNTGVSVSDTATVVVRKSSVTEATGTATNVNTGIGDSLLGSLLLPLGLSALLLFIFKSQLLGFDKWATVRKEQTNAFRAQKRLMSLAKKRK